MVVAIDSTTLETTACSLFVSFFALCRYLGCYMVLYDAVWWSYFNKNGDDIFFVLLWIADGSCSPDLTYHYDREMGTWSNYNHISNLISRIHVSHQSCGPVPYHSDVGGKCSPYCRVKWYLNISNNTKTQKCSRSINNTNMIKTKCLCVCVF